MNYKDKAEWLAAQFEFEYCAECGRDAEDHEVVGVMGNPFAYCLRPREEDSQEQARRERG